MTHLSETTTSRSVVPADETHRLREAGRLLFGQRLRPIWICVGVLFALLTLLRVALLLAKYDLLVGTVGWDEIGRCFLLGARFDAVAVGYAMVPLVAALTLASPAALGRPAFRKAVTIYATAAITVFVATEVVGACFFLRFGRRLNYMAIAYLAHRETLLFMWNHYPAWLLVPLWGTGTWLVYRWLRRGLLRGAVGHWTPSRRLAAATVLGALCVLACRGGLERRPLLRSSAYFCANQLVDQLAMNDFYTMFYAARSELTDGRDERKAYQLPSVDRAAGVTQHMLFLPGDQPLVHPANPLGRRSHSLRPRRDYNVVVILMEGMAGTPVGALGYRPSHTPQLDALCAEGVFFERMYAVGARTSRAVVGALCGHPDLGGTTIMKRPRAVGRFLTLPDILRRRGYRTLFVYGGLPQFDNMGPFLTAAGVEEFLDQSDMDAKPGNWGVPDESIFRRAHERFEELGDGPFFATILTISNHDPFEVPAGRVEMLPDEDNDRNRELNAYRYADWAMGEFFRYARGARYFERTIFVLVADHGRNLNQLRMVDAPGFRVPCVIYAPGIVAPGRVATVASQTDVAPTILGLLGGEYEHCFLGRDLLRVGEDDGFALLHEDVHLAFVRDGLVLELPPGPNRPGRLHHLGPTDMVRVPADHGDAERIPLLREQMVCYYTMARHLYAAGAYCDPDRYVAAQPQPRSEDD